MKSSEYVNLGDAETVKRELKAATSIYKKRKYALNIPSHIRAEVGKCALCYGTQAAKKCFSLTYPRYEFKQCTANNWKKSRKIGSQEKAYSVKLEDPIKLTMPYWVDTLLTMSINEIDSLLTMLY